MKHAYAQPNPHIPMLLTWQVISQTGKITWSTQGVYAPGTWWPQLTLDFAQLISGRSDENWWKSLEINQNDPYYVCPENNQKQRCGGASDYYCKNWGCETTGTGYWIRSSTRDYIQVKKHTEPSKALVEFTSRGKADPRLWHPGKTWGLRIYEDGYDRGLLFTIKLKLDPIVSVPIGPNPVLRPPPREPPLTTPSKPKAAYTPTSSIPTSSIPNALLPQKFRHNPDLNLLFNLIQGAYATLNRSSPIMTKECWLCLVSLPPYYEAIAVTRNFSNSTVAPQQCLTPQHKLTLSEVSGHGLCVGQPSDTHQALCNSTLAIFISNYYLTAPKGAYWACNSGLTTCISAIVLNRTRDYCILVELWPRIVYHEPENFYNHFEDQVIYKREPVSITLALLLGGLTVGGITAGIGTGTAALIETSQFQQLQQAMHADIQALEESVSALEKSLTSLSEVVLQNRRGLDILFLQEGGLCAALKEECCFYADHTGIVRDNMAKLRERLKQRQQLFESQQGWFETWFNKSPWLTTLISSLIGPLIILLLILLFGPCILNRIIQFVRDRFSVVQALVLTQQYHQVRQNETEDY